MKISPIRTFTDKRALAALEFIDASTKERVTSGLTVSSTKLKLTANRSGLFAITDLAALSEPEAELEKHLRIFKDLPDEPTVNSLGFSAQVKDQTGRYLPRIVKFSLPQNPSDLSTLKFELSPAPIAPLGANHSGIRASLEQIVDEERVPLIGARVSLRRISDNTEIGFGYSDKRGEVLVIVVGLPVIDFSTSEEEDAEDEDIAIGTKKTPVRLAIQTSTGTGWPPDPDAISSNGQNWVPVTGTLPEPELETGRLVTDGLALLLEPQT